MTPGAAEAAATGIPCTNHFLDRWCERFPGQGLGGLAAAFDRAEAVSTQKLLAWVTLSGKSSRVEMHKAYRHDPVTQALFTAVPLPSNAGGGEKWVLVTVFPFRKPMARRVVA